MINDASSLKILGSGESSGGVYDEVKISGSGDIKGDLECNVLKVLGAADICGNVKGGTIKISGAADIKGDIKADEMIVSGAADIDGSINCKNIKVAGAVDVSGSIFAEKLELAGGADIEGNCEAEIFNSIGAFDIGGMLNAGEINIKLKGKSSVEEIGGEKISVIKNTEFSVAKFFSISFNSTASRLECSVIEGDEIYLEYTKADIVRGKKIVLGPGCNIDKVEYSGSFECSKETKVCTENRIV